MPLYLMVYNYKIICFVSEKLTEIEKIVLTSIDFKLFWSFFHISFMYRRLPKHKLYLPIKLINYSCILIHHVNRQ